MNVVIAAILVLVGIGALLPGVYFYQKYQETKKLLQNPKSSVQEQSKSLIAQVEKIMELPKDEEPTVASISDAGKLKDQPFFSTAQDGDKVLIYTKAKQAILYRPSTNKIIAVAPLSVNKDEGTVAGAVTGTPVTVTIYNGTLIDGLAQKTQTQLAVLSSDFTVKNVGTATNHTYTETIVVDISGNHSQEASRLAELLHGKVKSLPSGENKPDTDLLVIVAE
jgi:hypothetical protein